MIKQEMLVELMAYVWNPEREFTKLALLDELNNELD